MARGFLAELNRMARAAQREAARQQRAAVREHTAAARRAEQARKVNERARAKSIRAAKADRKRSEKEAKAAYVAAREAEAEERNAGLAEIYEAIDGLLAATLDVDDHVDLETLRKRIEHPPFDRADLETPIPKPDSFAEPKKPVLSLPDPPTGLFARKKKHAKTVAALKAAYAADRAQWKVDMEAIQARNKAAVETHIQSEEARVAALEQERRRYAKECAEREAEINAHNERLDTLIANLGYGTIDAVQEYISIVMSNSIYPEHFQVEHEFTFDPATAELAMTVKIPAPSTIPDIKTYKFNKSTDKLTTTTLSQKACKDRYSGAVHQVALRSLHEVYEADRRGLIKTISLVLGTEASDPATGSFGFIPFVAVGASRDTFMALDLSAVVPAVTLQHLGAAVSKNPFSLVPANTTGIRRS